jgi:hypothetical protein
MQDTTKVLDQLVNFDQDTSTNDLIIKRTQDIPDDFVTALKANKIDSFNRPTGDMLHMASIPVSVVEMLLRDFQFDVMKEPVKRTLSMLKALHMDAFIVTDKQI